MTRLDWDVLIDGSDVWSVEVPPTGDDTEGSVISTTRDDGEENVTEALPANC